MDVWAKIYLAMLGVAAVIAVCFPPSTFITNEYPSTVETVSVTETIEQGQIRAAIAGELIPGGAISSEIRRSISEYGMEFSGSFACPEQIVPVITQPAVVQGDSQCLYEQLSTRVGDLENYVTRDAVRESLNDAYMEADVGAFKDLTESVDGVRNLAVTADLNAESAEKLALMADRHALMARDVAEKKQSVPVAIVVVAWLGFTYAVIGCSLAIRRWIIWLRKR